ncbi:FAD-dependent tricarballylate dehydrogenase TcuA [Sulfitobacter pseudonitzschiae]|uniref:FAD-dependent tricarballylate dehydrogenase TcuA n=1 Tax=Pseudosulfitobacter pseudonitzschiae TaxID=1402135 RepID=A0A9Q2RXW9_9RHOB|nr:FAD-dependent tricarballylate dehydrogenase TcuA [Pseudosulfitobacter pseudonitzschiae]MBM2299869.1 FAD-dependent tricarballylate dehydrogenase TcuA [Pseudosulfitobacter pseudonitzschiae]MBM2304790.1 FAD-dependent tricarballylate dehydrogenase TcuA [Pseudosulfitobacter pseudonitzschiae]MBM2314564.1 FAD-dependent tricarballylate dehydrogenase TcuA [Pseudosulfitobacter pseudonitzschiae]MBM2319474.1 FAD-dependent tricarballylate dehydrogenase TcuA [Pseudosulfitobacter pseudonitzschiae]
MTPAGTNPDVVVIGGGNAALCAAITAAEAGARVLILEAAPKPYRGGNSRHTRNFRCMHQGPLGPLVDSYTEEEYLADLLKVTGGKTHEGLARLAIRTSEACLPWMEEHGVRFQPSLSGTLSLARTNAFFLGGGKGLVNAYYRTAERLGVEVVYEAQVTHLELDEDRITSVDYIRDGQTHRVTAKSVVVASGGFQADTDWLARAWGPAARNFLIRGTPYNRGVVLADLLAQDIAQVGDPTQCHAVAIDGRAPKFDGGIVTRLDCVPFSIVVNKDAERFYDEGEDVWPKRYAIWGRLVAAQPDQVGYVIIDAKSLNLFMPSVFPPIKADTLEELAGKLDLPAEALAETVATFNAACGDTSGFHPTELDGVATTGLTPPKTNWARPITEPPFYGYSLRTGVTFTYLGLKVDENAQCAIGDRPVTNLWAAGETMAGSILGQGYLAGFGMTIGTVFGRIAGKEAAAHAN